MKYRLEELVDLKIGRTPPRKEQQWFNQGSDDWKWVSIKDMGVSGRYISETSETISKEAQTKFNIPIVRKGTVILSFKLTVGRVAIVDEDMLTNEAIAQLPINDTNIVRPLYLYYLLKNFNFYNHAFFFVFCEFGFFNYFYRTLNSCSFVNGFTDFSICTLFIC